MWLQVPLTLVLTFSFMSRLTLAETVVNLLLFYEQQDTFNFFTAAQNFLTEQEKTGNAPVKLGKVHEFQIKPANQDALRLLQKICTKVDEVFNGAEDERPDFVLDFTLQGIPSESVKIITKVLQIPTISATYGQSGDIREWKNLNEIEKDYLIQISPPADILIQSVRSIADHQKMKSVAVLFDEKQYEMYHKYKTLLQDIPTRHVLRKMMQSKEKMAAEIDRLVAVDYDNFFISGKSKEINSILQIISDPHANDDLGFFNEDFAWYSMSLESDDGGIKCESCKSKISLVHLHPKMGDSGSAKGERKKRMEFFEKQEREKINSNCLTDIFYFDLTIDAILAVGKIKTTTKLTIDPPLTCAKYDPKNEVKEHKVNLYLELDKVAVDNIIPFDLTFKKNGKNYPKFETEIDRLEFDESGAKTKTKLGTWTPGFMEGDQFQGNESIQLDKNDSLEKHAPQAIYRVVTVVQPPFVYYNEDCTTNYDKNKHCFEGYSIDLLDIISKELNFKYTIKNVTGYGYMNSSHLNWDGMVREVMDRKADIGIGAVQLLLEREYVVDFTVPFYDLVGHTILMKKVRTETALFKFLTVLESDVWMCILGAYFFTSILMWIFDRWSPYSYQNNKDKFEDDEEKREFNLKECLWFCMTSLTPQGGGEAPKNLSGRLVAATWWLFGFIIVASYTANLAAFLTVSRLEKPVVDLEGLSRQYKIQYATQYKSSTWMYFDRMANIEHVFYERWKDMSLNDSMTEYERAQLAVWDYPVSDKYTKMWQAMEENKPPLTYEEAIDRVMQRIEGQTKEAFALLGDATDVNYQVLTNCALKKIGEEFSRKPYALMVQKGSPLKHKMSKIIHELREKRELERLKIEWWDNNKNKPKSCPKDEDLAEGIAIENIGGVFIVIFAGFAMTFFTLIFEYWWYKKRLNVNEALNMTHPPPPTHKPQFTQQYNKTQGPGQNEMPPVENSW